MEGPAVVTDIDGVLIDTSESYRRAIVETVRTVYGETIGREHIQGFKDAGGFNNDWRATEAVALYVLARREGYEGTVETFTDAIREHGGGIEAAKAVLTEQATPAVATAVMAAWDPGELRRTFQWLYLGPERYDALEEGPRPRNAPAVAGFIENEPILAESTTLAFLRERPYGVLTGRPRAEAEIALDRLELSPPPDRVRTMDDWEGGKPNPDGLIRIAEAMDARHVIYVGDELDDVRTAVNASQGDTSRRYTGLGVLTGGLRGSAGRTAFSEAGATAVLASIDELPDVISRG